MRTPALIMLLFLAFSTSAQWKEMNDGLEGGWIMFLESKDNNLFAGTTNGLYYSENNGETWTLVYETYGGWFVNDLLAFGDDLYLAVNNGKAFKSSNSGQSWTQIFSSDRFTFIDFVDGGNKIYAVANQDSSGLYTIDPVTAAVARVPGLDSVRNITVTTSKLFVGTNFHGVHTSSDGGVNWTKVGSIPNGIPVELSGSGSVLIAWPQRLISINEGATWSSFSFPLSYRPRVLKEGNTVYAGDWFHAMKSTDGGVSWSMLRGLPGINAIERTQWGLFAGGYAGIYRSTDGVNWTGVNNGIRCVGVTSLVALDKDLFAASANRIFRTNTGTWREHSFPTLPEQGITTLGVSNSTLIAGTFSDGVYYSNDKGTTWQRSEGIPGAGTIASMGSRVFAGSYFGLYESLNGGKKWHQIDSQGEVYSITLIQGYLYVSRVVNDGTYDASRYDGNGTKVSINSGLDGVVSDFKLVGDSLFCMTYWGKLNVFDSATFSWKNRFTFYGPGSISMASVHDRLYVSNGNWVVYSDDHGSHWTVYSAGIPLHVSSSFSFSQKALRAFNDDLYLATWSSGVWTTADIGTEPFAGSRSSENLPDFTIALWGGPGPEGPPFSDNFIDMDQLQAGFGMAYPEGITGIEHPNNVLKVFPNPVTTQLGITLDFQPGDRPHIEILDLNGRVLASEIATDHTLLIDTQSLATGLYLVRVTSQHGVIVRKFVRK